MTQRKPTSFRDIRLVLSDIDGTLITPTKEVTPSALQAISDLRARGIAFAIASSRPVRGMAKVAETVKADTPLSGFNGGRIVDAQGAVLNDMRFPEGVVTEVVATLRELGLHVWVFAGDDWHITDPHGPRIVNETHSIGYEAIVHAGFPEPVLAHANKLVGVSMDYPLVERAEALLNERFAGVLSATRSQPFYLDITPEGATKGAVVHFLAKHLGITPREVLTIGDGDNDTLMFAESGFSFAMGNGADAVKARADAVTARNSDEGFAKAMQQVLIGLG